VRLAGFRVPKRRDDWLMGRAVAKSVVAAALAEAVPCTWALAAIEIASDPGGAPYARVAPEAGPVAGFAPGQRLPVSVSISHAEAHAASAAIRCEAAEARTRTTLGIDLGLVEPRSRAFVETFFTEEEARFALDAPTADRDLRANLVWCGKEAVLKALGLGLTVDTREVCCLPQEGRADPGAWPLAPADAGWRPFAVRCSPTLLRRRGPILGVWRTVPGFVVALASHLAEG